MNGKQIPQSDDLAPCKELPVSACLIARDEFRQVVNDVREIKVAIIGREEFGHRGLVSRVAILERIVVVIAAGLILVGGERIVKMLF